MKTCDEMVNSLLKRREHFLIEQKQKRRKTAVKIAVSGCYCALAAVIGAGIWHSVISSNKDTIISENPSVTSDNSSAASSEPAKENLTAPQAPDYSSVIWAENGSDDIFNTLEIETSELNGKRIYPSLSEAFNKYGDDSVFAIAAYCYGYDDNFVYNGKTLAWYKTERNAAWDRFERRYQLMKFGDSLKYGEMVYREGTPDGERWSEEFYNDIVSTIGEELISEYIVDEEFLKDKLFEDISKSKSEFSNIDDTYNQGRTACWKYIFETAAEQIPAQGIYCETKYSLDSPYLLVIFASKDEFETLVFDNMDKWCFVLAQKNENGFYAGEFVIDCDDSDSTQSIVNCDQ